MGGLPFDMFVGAAGLVKTRGIIILVQLTRRLLLLLLPKMPQLTLLLLLLLHLPVMVMLLFLLIVIVEMMGQPLLPMQFLRQLRL